MAEESYDEYDDDLEDEEEEDQNFIRVPKKEYRSYQKRAKRVADYEAQLAKKDRELAFARSKVPNDKKGQIFMKAYEGDMTTEAIDAEWEELFGSPAQDEQAIPDEEVQAHEAISNASATAQPSTNKDYAALMNQASTQDEVMALAREANLPIREQ